MDTKLEHASIIGTKEISSFARAITRDIQLFSRLSDLWGIR